MKLTLIIGMIFLFNSLFSQRVSDHFAVKNQGLTIEFKMEGKLNGKYVSKYPNGAVFAEGNFKDNLRTGVWTVYDSLGRKIHQRDYSVDFLSFEKLYPEKQKTGPASLFDTSFYHPIKNKEGFIPYFELKERMVVFSTRLWRSIPQEDNSFLYKKNFLYKSLFSYITDSTSGFYCSKDENFVNELSVDELKKFSLNDYKVIDWKLKEDFILDSERMVSEVRIIGICPVGIEKKTGDTLDLYWIYFPYARKALAQTKTKIKNGKGEIQTLDDIFFFRNFISDIYKKSNVYDLELKDYCKNKNEMEFEKWRIESELLETEHRFWMGELSH
jgi:hypothetical protein